MENKFLENKIKSTFDSYQPELDNDAIWEDIEPHLTKKKDRKYFIFWFFLVGLALGFWFFNKGSHSTLEQKDMALTENVNPVPTNEMDHTDIATNEISPFEIKKEPAISTIKKKKVRSSKNNSIELKNVLSNVIFPKRQNNIDQVNEPIAELPNWNTDLITAKSLTFSGLEMAATNYLEQIDLDKINNNFKKKRKRIKPSRNNRWDIIFQSTIAPIFPIKTLNRKNTGSVSYLENRKATESQLEGFGINFNFQIQNKKGFVIMTGVEYQQFNEKFDQQIVSERTETITGPIIIFENGDGEVIETINGPRVITTNTEKRKRRFNNYRFINMPFGIGRAWKNEKAFYKFSGGLSYNMLFAFSGNILSPTTDRTYAGDFKNKIGFGFWFSGEYSRAVNDRLKWVIAPKIQLPFQSITADNYGLSQRYYPISLNLGVNYLLNPKKKINPINRDRKK